MMERACTRALQHVVMQHIVMQHIGYRQTKPHIGWMLFENHLQSIDVQTVRLKLSDSN